MANPKGDCKEVVGPSQRPQVPEPDPITDADTFGWTSQKDLEGKPNFFYQKFQQWCEVAGVTDAQDHARFAEFLGSCETHKAPGYFRDWSFHFWLHFPEHARVLYWHLGWLPKEPEMKLDPQLTKPLGEALDESEYLYLVSSLKGGSFHLTGHAYFPDDEAYIPDEAWYQHLKALPVGVVQAIERASGANELTLLHLLGLWPREPPLGQTPPFDDD